MRSVVALVSVLALLGGSACDEGKNKRRAATLAKLAKTDCKAIAAKAKRCDSAVRKAAERQQQKTGKKHLALTLTLGLTAYKSVTRCQRHVSQRVGFLKKDCKKFAKSVKSADFCRIAQRRYLRELKALNHCFTSDDCKAIATCYVQKLAASQR